MATSPENFPRPSFDPKPSTTGEQKAVLAGGCFWCVEAVYRQLDGVGEVVNGYAGGTAREADYGTVSTGMTGHAEAVEVTYDPSKVSYDDLLNVFWQLHDPTTLNRQGPDVGTQYRSAIFFHDAEQETAAKASKEALQKSGTYKKPIVTEMVPASEFWQAEEYHQQYLEKRGLAHCTIK